jgi:polyisoprenoid-binding protein YceI
MHRSLRNFFVATALVGGLALPSLAVAGMSVTGKPAVSFNAEGSPGFLDIEGTTSSITAADDGTTLTLTVPMSTVKTGIDLRDEHMNNEYVQIASHPNAVMTLKKADVKWPTASGEKTSGTVAGTFNIHGQSQAVNIGYNISKTTSGYKVAASFKFDCSKSGITIPAYMGVTVDPKMSAKATLELADAP